MRNKRWLWLVAVIVGAASLMGWGGQVLAAPMVGNTYQVIPTGDGVGSCLGSGGAYSCTTLRAAVIAANANPGSTIQLVHGATYTLTVAPAGLDDATSGDLNLTADMTFAFIPAACFSNCAATLAGGAAFTGRLLSIENGARVSATQLNLRGGRGQGAVYPTKGGAVLVVGAGSAFSLTAASVYSNSAARQGGGLAVEDGAALLLNTVQVLSNTLTDMVFADEGGGLFLSYSSAVITGSTFGGNFSVPAQTLYGAGVACSPFATLTLTNTVVRDNHSAYHGGGLYIMGCQASVTGGQVMSNTADNGGGVYYDDNGESVHLVLQGVAVTHNSASDSGGGIFMSTTPGYGSVSVVSLLSSTLGFNMAATSGGGMYLEGGACTGTPSTCTLSVMLTDTAVYGNQAHQAGGGVYNTGALVMTGGNLTGNHVWGTPGNWTTGGGGAANFGQFRMANVQVNVNYATTAGGAGLLNGAGAALTVTSGTFDANIGDADGGGGLLNAGSASLTSVSLFDNLAINTGGQGGGIYNSGQLTLTGGELRHNSANADHGGGLYNVGLVTAANVTLISNTTQASGGGLYNLGRVSLTEAQVLSNSAPSGWGGGIVNWGTAAQLVFSGGAVQYNSAASGAGVVNSDGNLTATASLFAHNTATSLAGGLANLGWSAGSSGSMWIDRSTIWDNKAISALSNSGQGGGIYNTHVLRLTNDTLSGNRAFGHGGGLYQLGGANPAPSTDLNNVTIAGNASDANGNGVGTGGGVNVVSGTLTVRNSLLAGNTDGFAAAGPDCSGALTSQGYNLLQDAMGCWMGGVTTGNIVGQDPLLGPLQDNGGPTWTQALPPNSPAFNHGNPGAPGANTLTCRSQDQRGLFRPAGGRCDIGAYEIGAGLGKTYLTLVVR